MERTEMQKIIMEPIEVNLGDKTYPIKPLPIKQAIPWLKKVVDLLIGSISLSQIKANDTETMQSAMQKIMIDNPGLIVDLVFDYAKNLNREEIENTASSAQLMKAFEQCLEFEKPFLMGMTTLKTLSAPVSKSS